MDKISPQIQINSMDNFSRNLGYDNILDINGNYLVNISDNSTT